MANLAEELMDDREGPFALVVADDDGLRESLYEVMRELGFATARRSFRTATREPFCEHGPFVLALLSVGRGLPGAMREVANLLAFPALSGADVLLGTTVAAKDMPVLPAADRAASITFLRMPFELDDLDQLAQKRLAAARRSPVLRSASAGWDDAAERRRRAAPCGSYEHALPDAAWFQHATALDRGDHVAKAC